jgi:hypothetical protein
VYFPKEKRHRFINQWLGVDPSSPSGSVQEVGTTFKPEDKMVKVEFEKEVPESILAHRPLYMLVQVIDSSHVRVGFKAKQGDPWHFSKILDIATSIGKIEKLAPWPCISSQVTWPFLRAPWGKGYGIGNYPLYPQFQIDYVHYRRGLSK